MEAALLANEAARQSGSSKLWMMRYSAVIPGSATQWTLGIEKPANL
jgi:hypothetical protein